MSYDPAISKNGGSVQNPIAAPGPTYAPAPTYAAPVNATYVQQPYGQSSFAPPPVQGQAQVLAAPAAQSRAPQTGRWADSICDWTSNLFPSCYCACCVCYGMYLNAQMAQKTGFMSFKNTLIVYACVWLFSLVFVAIFPASGIILWMPLLVAFFYAIFLRLHIVKRDRIQECGSNPCFGEFCCGFWCWYCSITQMARHLYGYKQVFDGDGNPDRPDSYGNQGLGDGINVAVNNSV